MGQGNWWWPFFPGMAIVADGSRINFMGDGLRDALDPRSRDCDQGSRHQPGLRRASRHALGPKPADDVLLEVRGLRTYFHVMDGTVQAVDGVDFQIKRGESLGLVGESGCGKSVTALRSCA